MERKISRRKLLRDAGVAGVAGAAALVCSHSGNAQSTAAGGGESTAPQAAPSTKQLLEQHEDYQVSLASGEMVVAFDLRYGSISSITRKSDPYGTNYIGNAQNTPGVDAADSCWTGDLVTTTWELLRDWKNPDLSPNGSFQSSGKWRRELTGRSSDIRQVNYNKGSFTVTYRGQSANVDGLRSYELSMVYHWAPDGSLLWDIELTNTTDKVLEIGELGLPLMVNDDYGEFAGRSAADTAASSAEDRYQARTKFQQALIHEQKVLVHHFIAGHSSYALVQRPLGDAPFLLVHPTMDTAFECIYNDDPQTSSFATGVSYWEGPDILAIHSRATKELRKWRSNPWINGHTSLILQPGEAKSYQMRFAFIPGYEAIRDELYRAGNLGVRIAPSMVVQESQEVHVELRSQSSIDKIQSLSDNITIQSKKVVDNGTLLTLSFKGRGQKSLKLFYGKGRWTNLHFYCTEDFESLLKGRAKFIVDREFYENREDPYGRNHMFLPFDYRRGSTFLESDEVWEVGGSDEPGFSASLFLAEKNVYFPAKKEVDALETYVADCLFKHIQNPETYAVRASLYWKERSPSSQWSEWSKERSEATWRTYNYVHPANIYHALYRIGKTYGLLSRKTPEEYLKMSYFTCMKWFVTGPWKHVGLMEGSNAIHILEDIRREGWTTEYESLLQQMKECDQAFVEQPYPYGSELLIDQTAHEQVYFFTRYFGDKAKNAKTVQVLKALRGGNQPVWFRYGNDKRRDICCWYSASLNGLALLRSFEDSGDLDALNKGYGGVTSVISNVTMDGMGFNYFDCKAGVFGHEPQTTWEGGCGLWGFLQSAKSYVVKDAVFGLVGYGCRVEATDERIAVSPQDGVRKRVLFTTEKVGLEVTSGEISEVVLFPRENKIHLRVSDSTGLAKNAIVIVRGMPGGQYQLTHGHSTSRVTNTGDLTIQVPMADAERIELKKV